MSNKQRVKTNVGSENFLKFNKKRVEIIVEVRMFHRNINHSLIIV